MLENVILGTRPLWRAGLGEAAARARLDALARDFGLSVRLDARVKTLSVGERQRVEILKALYRDARILILDEPTAVLTPQESEALFDTLRKAVARGLSVIFISHKLHEVMAISERVVVLRHGRLVGEVATRDTDRHGLAEMMVGAEVALPKAEVLAPGEVLFELRDVSTPAEGRRVGLARVSLCAARTADHRDRRRVGQRPGRARRPDRRPRGARERRDAGGRRAGRGLVAARLARCGCGADPGGPAFARARWRISP